MPVWLLLAAFTAADATPTFPAGDAQAAVSQLHLGQYGQAVQSMRRYLAHHPRGRDHNPAEYVLALALEQDGAYADARARFERLLKAYPLLLPQEAYHSARSAYLGHDYEGALDLASQVPETAPLHMDAMLLAGDALRALGRWDDTEKLYARYLDKYPQGIRLAEATFKLAEAREKLSRPVRDLYMKVWVVAPLDWGVQAEAHLDHPAQKATAREWITRAMVLFDAMRNVESENAFAAALAAPGLDPEMRCVASFHRAQSVFKQRNRTRAIPLFEEAITACVPTTNEDLKAKALYTLARCEYAKGDFEKAAVDFLKVEAEYPKHSYADDGRLRAAESYAEISEDDARIDPTLRELPDKHPDGDMKQEALWRLALRAWRHGAMEEALKWLDEGLRRIPREDIWYAEGRSYYWKGRVLAELGRTDEALLAWESCVRAYPLGYYALLALNRLRERAPAREAKLVAELAPRHPSDAWHFPARPLFAEAGFRRGVELARMGLGEEARREFGAVGIKAVGKIKVDEPERRQLLWLTTLLLDRAGIWRQSHWIARHALEDDWHRDWPRGETHKKWLLAYPRGYAQLLTGAARSTGYPEALLFAITREESAFDPGDESFANAIGLLQMIIPTAKRYAKKGEVVSRETLRDPIYNVQVGIRWLSFLWELFDHNLALAAAGHNAGEGAVGRWLRERGDLALDEWVETIPYDETRNYTKRVMASLFAYHWLYGRPGVDPVPRLGQSLPKLKHSARKRPGVHLARRR